MHFSCNSFAHILDSLQKLQNSLGAYVFSLVGGSTLTRQLNSVHCIESMKSPLHRIEGDPRTVKDTQEYYW